MNMESIQGSHLLSSISNISVKIDHNEIDDLGFFPNSVHQKLNLYQNQQFAVINAIPHDQFYDGRCLFETILAKVSTETNASLEENNLWIFDEDLAAVPEDLPLQIQIKSPKLQPKKKHKIIKRKSKPKRKTSKKLKKLQNLELFDKKRSIQVRQRNETKNIPKNYGKAIISFASKHNPQVKHISQLNQIDYEGFKKELKEVKSSFCTIADLRKLWVEFKYAKLMRIVGDLFLRKYSLRWIFNSKISNTNAHVKYRHKLLRAIKEPSTFQYMKGN